MDLVEGQPKEKEKTNGLGSKTGGGEGQPKEKEKTNGLVGSKTGGWGGPT